MSGSITATLGLQKQLGFTLIEVLVVMLIISIVGAATLLTISHNQNSRLENFSRQLTSLITLAEEEAMLEPAVLGLQFTNDTLQFFRYQEADAKQNAAWQPVTNSVLGSRRLPKNAQLILKVNGEQFSAEKTKEPPIIISTNGDLTPFVILIGEKNSAPRYQVTGAEDGSVNSARVTDEK